MNPQPYAVRIITLREIDTRAVPLILGDRNGSRDIRLLLDGGSR